MKNKMMKLMGIVLTLAVLAGLLMTSIPVSAGNLTWDNVVLPSATTSTYQLVQNQAVTSQVIAADGKTMFAYATTGAAGTVTTTSSSAIVVAVAPGATTYNATVQASTGGTSIVLVPGFTAGWPASGIAGTLSVAGVAYANTWTFASGVITTATAIAGLATGQSAVVTVANGATANVAAGATATSVPVSGATANFPAAGAAGTLTIGGAAYAGTWTFAGSTITLAGAGITPPPSAGSSVTTNAYYSGVVSAVQTATAIPLTGVSANFPASSTATGVTGLTIGGAALSGAWSFNSSTGVLTVAGPTIANGTGTATPLTVVLGLNTYTATVAGTFTFNLPAGYTATSASGGATLTAPGALAVGANTLNTGITTGTFTVTVAGPAATTAIVASATLAGTAASTTMTVANAAGLAPTGTITVGGTTTVLYTGVSGNTLTGLTITVGGNQPSGATVVQTGGIGILYKSTDGGMTWTTTNVGGGLPTGVVAMAISPAYATDTTLIAATAGSLFRSRNAGQTFSAVTGFAAVGAINSIDIAQYYISSGGQALLVGGTTGIALYNDNDNWTVPLANSPSSPLLASSIGVTTPGFAGGTILFSKFSPTYQTDGEVLAVVSNVNSVLAPPLGMGMTAGPGTVLETKFASSAWNATVRPALLQTTGGLQITTATAADLAFPSDYNSSSSTLNRVYLSLGNPAGGPFDAFRVSGNIDSTGTVVVASNLKLTDSVSANNASIAYTGTVASGTVVVGQFGTGGVWYGTSPNGTAVWTQAQNPPTGQDVTVNFPPPAATANASTLYAITNNITGSGGWGSAIATSTDYNAYKEVSLISIPDLSKLSVSQPQWPIKGSKDQYFLMTYTQTGGAPPTPVAVNDAQMIFKSSDNGATWAEVLGRRSTTAGTTGIPGTVMGVALNNIYPTGTYATDNTVYVTQTTGLIWKTTDAGNTWNSITSTTPDNSISAFAVIDANNYWLGATGGGLYKSGSYTQVATLDGAVPFQIFLLPIGMVVNTWTGEVYISNDQGATFMRLGNANQFGTGVVFNSRANLAFDVAGKTIYATNSPSSQNNSLYKWTLNTDTSWITWCSITYPNPTNTATTLTPTGVISMTLAPDLTLYLRINNDVPGTTDQIIRCVNLTAPQGQQAFAGIPQTDSGASNFNNTSPAGNLPGGKATWIGTDAVTKSNLIYEIVNRQPAPYTQNGYPVVIKSYVDTMTVGPAITAPKAKDSIGTTYTFTWNTVTSPSQVTYQWQIATDDQFNGIQFQGTTTATSAHLDNLVAGTQYYLRVQTTLPLPSAWSATVPFLVKVGVSTNQDLTGPLGNRIAPAAGATGVPLTPSFQWASITGDNITYHIQVADNPGFTTPLADATTKDTFYSVTTALKPGTTYYWRVQAISGSNAGDYISNVFTTAAATGPAAPTGPATSVPPAQVVNPTIIVTVPPAAPVAPPSTPAYVWVIIVIGAILVIAVIVLIARTRRV